MKNNARAVVGFTLVELLVVIAVITILAGLLLPGLSAARAGLLYSDAKNLVGFVDGHVSYVKIYFDGPIPRYACFYSPPAGYDYQWSPD